MAVRPAGVFQAAPNRYLATGWWRPPGGPSPHQVCRLPTRWWMSSWLAAGCESRAPTSPDRVHVLVGIGAPRGWRLQAHGCGWAVGTGQGGEWRGADPVTQYAGW
ncbi:hypothetical protein, partial [Fodinicola feengrottensis]|uniref:hypothetical protein n=1 Tax=Fodinicola feengrottensis TaxID=435914 RepID=UPI00244152B0